MTPTPPTAPPSAQAQLQDHLPSWPQLQAHRQGWKQSLNELFQQDPHRAEHYSLQAGPLWLDYSKNHLTETTLKHLLSLARECQLPEAIADLLAGEPVNNTEHRPAWHTALRSRHELSVSAEIRAARQQMADFTGRLQRGEWCGYSGEAITDVVNIGIGGSDLGPRMVCKALGDFHLPALRVHFVANIDAAELDHTLQPLDPARTLFIVASKSFSTLETLANANCARQWLQAHGCPHEQLSRHFVAITTNTAKAVDFGIEADNVFPMWDWVGGRYSLWSTIGLPIALAIGWQAFEELLDGAATMDEHFASAELDQNLPVLLALITFWYGQCWQARSQAVLPYCHPLQQLPDFLQQLDMESLGKSVNRAGQPVSWPTGLVLWGTEESNGQHSFHQLLHQGTQVVPADFIATLQPNHPHREQHRQLLACCLSQSQALLQGKSLSQARRELLAEGLSSGEAARLAPHKVIPGDRPSNTLLLERLTPYSLGSLIAAYEHKVFCLGVLLDINPFDQWGVELGKQLAGGIDEALVSGALPEEWDSSTRLLASKVLDSGTI